MNYPCDKCKELVPVDEHYGNDRHDGSSEYLCCECYESQNQRVCEVMEIIKGIQSEGGHWHFKPNATATGYELMSQTVQVNGTLWNTLAATISPTTYRAVINKRANNDKR